MSKLGPKFVSVVEQVVVQETQIRNKDKKKKALDSVLAAEEI